MKTTRQAKIWKNKIKWFNDGFVTKIQITDRRDNKVVYTENPNKKSCLFSFDDTEPLDQISLPRTRFCDVPFTFYYLRITQVDNEMAWVSPVWFLCSD